MEEYNVAINVMKPMGVDPSLHSMFSYAIETVKICSAILPIFAANRCCSASTSTQNPHPKPILTNSMMVDYLVASFGFSPDKAAKVSKLIAHLNSSDKPEAVCRFLNQHGFSVAHLKSLDKPESVRRFLNQHGFSNADIKTIITLRPKLLAASPEDTLEPNLRALRDIGLSISTLTQLILSGPAVLHSSSAASRIKLWRDFSQGDDQSLVKAFKNNVGIGGHDISRSISPKISLLQSHRLSIHDIQRIVLLASRLILHKLSALEDALKRAKEMGFQPESWMFAAGLHAMMAVSRGVLQKRMELLRSFGWSEDEFLSELCKAPRMVALTEKCLQAKMDFLIGEANCHLSYIASCPVLTTLSLEKRLRPRLHVLHLLEPKGLSGTKPSFNTAVRIADKKFMERFILPHKEEIAELHEAYHTIFA